MPKTAWLAGASFLIVACNGNMTTEAPGHRADSVHGVQHDVTANGVVDQVLDDGRLAGVVLSPSPDWWEVRRGDARDYVPAAATPPDVSVYHFGRSDVAFPTSETRVAVELSGLAWHDGDSLELVTPNVGLAISGLETHLAYPKAGATALGGQSFDWKNAFSPSLDAARGDVTWVAQMASAAADAGSYYSVLTRAGTASGFTVTDGQPSTLAATLAPIAQDRGLALHWKGSEFAALAAQAGPGARPAPFPALSIRTLPEPLAQNNNFADTLYMYLPSVVELGPIRGSEDFVQDIRYGNPFASNNARWTELVTMVYAMPVMIPGVGGTHAMVVQASPVDSLVGGVFAPAISPVRNVKLDGQSLDTPRAGVGTSPTITWEAPAIGTSTNYAIAVKAIERSGDSISITTVATFHTTSMSLKLPEFVGKSASSYILAITAISANDRDLGAKPFIGSLPYASADYVTARITP